MVTRNLLITCTVKIRGKCNGQEISILEMERSFNTSLTCHTENISLGHFSVLPPVTFGVINFFAQSYKSDPVDFLNALEIRFPMVYNMSLYKFFLG